MPPPNKTDAYGLAVAVVLTLEFAEIANVRAHLDDVESLIVDANHCIIERLKNGKCCTPHGASRRFDIFCRELANAKSIERGVKCSIGVSRLRTRLRRAKEGEAGRKK